MAKKKVDVELKPEPTKNEEVVKALEYALQLLNGMPKTKEIGMAHACTAKALDNLK